MKEKLKNLMNDRYGLDHFGLFMVCFGIFLIIISSIVRGKSSLNFVYILLYIISILLIVFAVYRVFSKDRERRYKENCVYFRIYRTLKRKCKIIYCNLKSGTYKYFDCPKCKQLLYIRRGNGPLIMTCPKCENQFAKRT